MMFLQGEGGQGGPGEEAQQDGRGASDGQVGPLALGFHAQMGVRLLEGGFPPEADQRNINDWRIWGGSAAGSVQSRAWGSKVPSGAIYLAAEPSISKIYQQLKNAIISKVAKFATVVKMVDFSYTTIINLS